MYALERGIRSPENTHNTNVEFSIDSTKVKGFRIPYYVTHCKPEDTPSSLMRKYRDDHPELRYEIPEKSSRKRQSLVAA